MNTTDTLSRYLLSQAEHLESIILELNENVRKLKEASEELESLSSPCGKVGEHFVNLSLEHLKGVPENLKALTEWHLNEVQKNVFTAQKNTKKLICR
jgi:hypothetical protein